MFHAAYRKICLSKVSHIWEFDAMAQLSFFFPQNAVLGMMADLFFWVIEHNYLAYIALLAAVLISQNELVPYLKRVSNPHPIPTAPLWKPLPFFLPTYCHGQSNEWVFTALFRLSLLNCQGVLLNLGALDRVTQGKNAVIPRTFASMSRVLLCFYFLQTGIFQSGRFTLQIGTSLQWYNSTNADSRDEKGPFLSIVSLSD